MANKYRIVQREGLFYVQKRSFFIWFYESNVNYLHKLFRFKVDRLGMVGFDELETAKEYLHKLVNSKTRVVYELKD